VGRVRDVGQLAARAAAIGRSDAVRRGGGSRSLSLPLSPSPLFSPSPSSPPLPLSLHPSRFPATPPPRPTPVDLRGNHDGFAAGPRGPGAAPRDAWGQRSVGGWRARAGVAGAPAGPEGRTQTLELPASLERGADGAWHRAAARPGGGPPCPAATVVAVDLTPEVGTPSPLNAWGRWTAAARSETEAALAAASAAGRACATADAGPAGRRGRAATVAASHYPLAAVAPEGGGVGGAGGISLGPLFGGLLPGSPAHPAAAALSRGGASVLLSGHLHVPLLGDRPADAHRGVGADGAVDPTAVLHDLAAGDWKNARALRMVSVLTTAGGDGPNGGGGGGGGGDGGGPAPVVAVSDWRFRAARDGASGEPVGWRIESADAALGGATGETEAGAGAEGDLALLHLAAPPDARMAPSAPPGEVPDRMIPLRVLVFPLDPAARAAGEAWFRDADVAMAFACRPSPGAAAAAAARAAAESGVGDPAVLRGEVPLAFAGAPARVYEGDWPVAAARSCRDGAEVEVWAVARWTGPDGVRREARSPRRPAALPVGRDGPGGGSRLPPAPPPGAPPRRLRAPNLALRALQAGGDPRAIPGALLCLWVAGAALLLAAPSAPLSGALLASLAARLERPCALTRRAPWLGAALRLPGDGLVAARALPGARRGAALGLLAPLVLPLLLAPSLGGVDAASAGSGSPLARGGIQGPARIPGALTWWGVVAPDLSAPGLAAWAPAAAARWAPEASLVAAPLAVLVFSAATWGLVVAGGAARDLAAGVVSATRWGGRGGAGAAESEAGGSGDEDDDDAAAAAAAAAAGTPATPATPAARRRGRTPAPRTPRTRGAARAGRGSVTPASRSRSRSAAPRGPAAASPAAAAAPSAADAASAADDGLPWTAGARAVVATSALVVAILAALRAALRVALPPYGGAAAPAAPPAGRGRGRGRAAPAPADDASGGGDDPAVRWSAAARALVAAAGAWVAVAAAAVSTVRLAAAAAAGASAAATRRRRRGPAPARPGAPASLGPLAAALASPLLPAAAARAASPPLALWAALTLYLAGRLSLRCGGAFGWWAGVAGPGPLPVAAVAAATVLGAAGALGGAGEAGRRR